MDIISTRSNHFMWIDTAGIKLWWYAPTSCCIPINVHKESGCCCGWCCSKCAQISPCHLRVMRGCDSKDTILSGQSNWNRYYSSGTLYINLNAYELDMRRVPDCTSRSNVSRCVLIPLSFHPIKYNSTLSQRHNQQDNCACYIISALFIQCN